MRKALKEYDGDLHVVIHDPDHDGESDRRTGENERPYPAPADQSDGEGDREGRYGMVTGKGGFVRGRDQKERLRGVGEERSFPHPDMRDCLRDEKS